MTRNLIYIGFALLAITGLTISLLTATLSRMGRQFDDADSLNAHIETLMQGYEIPVAAVAYLADGETVHMAGYAQDDSLTITPQSHFQIASVSKPLSAWGVMALVENGQIGLDASVVNQLSYALPTNDYPTDNVTLRRLLSHSAGVNISGYPGYSPTQTTQTLRESLASAEDVYQAPQVELVYEPASQAQYSGGGFSLLQLLVEDITGTPFDAYMQETIFIPLGMTHTTVVSAASNETLVPVYDADGSIVPPHEFSALAAGGIISTAEDLAIWLQAMLGNQTQTILSDQTLQAMYTPQENATWTYGRSYGLGYELDQTIRTNTRLVMHPGNNPPGWRSYIAALPDHNTGIIVLTSSPHGTQLYNALNCGWLAHHTGDMTQVCIIWVLEGNIFYYVNIGLIIALCLFGITRRPTDPESHTQAS